MISAADGFPVSASQGGDSLQATVKERQPGKAANLVLPRRSPLESVDAYDSIVEVWTRGRRMAREPLAPAPGG